MAKAKSTTDEKLTRGLALIDISKGTWRTTVAADPKFMKPGTIIDFRPSHPSTGTNTGPDGKELGWDLGWTVVSAIKLHYGVVETKCRPGSGETGPPIITKYTRLYQEFDLKPMLEQRRKERGI